MDNTEFRRTMVAYLLEAKTLGDIRRAREQYLKDVKDRPQAHYIRRMKEAIKLNGLPLGRFYQCYRLHKWMI